MNPNRTFSFFVTTLCGVALPFAVSAPALAAVVNSSGATIGAETIRPTTPRAAKSVGSVQLTGGATVKINNKTAGKGAEVKIGDVLETGDESVTVTLASGLQYVIEAGSKVRITRAPNGEVALLVIYGGVHPVDGPAEFVANLPWLPAFGNGNASFPSIGGVGGRTVSTVLPTGQVIFTTVSN